MRRGLEDTIMDIHLQNSVAGPGSNVTQKVAAGSTAEPASGAGASAVPTGADVPAKPEILVSQVTQNLLAESPVDEDRVASISSRIQSGDFQIDPKRVADRLIDLEQSLP
jgi:flagellar biosynthesis anti-sigma factor FlgM